MNKTRRVRKGGAGLLSTIGEAIGLKKKSPFTVEATKSPGEAALEKQMKNLQKSIDTLRAMGDLEGMNVSKAIDSLVEKREKIRLNLANMRGKTGVLNIMVNPSLKKGGKRTLRRCSTRRRLQK